MKRRWQLSSAVFVLTVLLAATACSSGTGKTEVVIKPNADDGRMFDVFVKDAQSNNHTKFITLRDVYSWHYHSAEYHQNHLYIVSRPGQEGPGYMLISILPEVISRRHYLI